MSAVQFDQLIINAAISLASHISYCVYFGHKFW